MWLCFKTNRTINVYRGHELDTNQSVLSHFHTDSSSSPGQQKGAYPSTEYVLQLSNGDVLIVLETIISVSNAHEQPRVSLEVQPLTPLSKPTDGLSHGTDIDILQSFLQQTHHMEINIMMPLIRTSITVVQPLKIACESVPCRNKVCMSISVENCFPGEPVYIQDLVMHLERTRRLKSFFAGMRILNYSF